MNIQASAWVRYRDCVATSESLFAQYQSSLDAAAKAFQQYLEIKNEEVYDDLDHESAVSE